MATEAPFPEEEYLARYQRAQALMQRDGVDALLVSEKNNYWYFSGLISYQLDHIQRPQILVLPKTGKPLLLVYGNDKAKAKALPWVGEVRAYTDVPFPEEMIAGCIKEMGLGEAKIGFELGDDQRLGFPVNYLTRLTEALPKAEIKASTRYDDRRYNKGDRMIADFGACYEGYYGDVTRMAIFGAPTDEHRRDHETACDVIDLCFESMRPDTALAEVSRVANRELVKRGYETVESPKRIGHGIGMSRAEPPSLNEVETELYRPGMVLALEPKVRSAKSAVHLEEDILITDKGQQFLTTGCRRLDVID
jgi:Xaa-Pro aminopeptidase